jgi:hypothetical protein
MGRTAAAAEAAGRPVSGATSVALAVGEADGVWLVDADGPVLVDEGVWLVDGPLPAGVEPVLQADRSKAPATAAPTAATAERPAR